MNVISVRGVTKRYRLRHPHRPHTLHEALSRGFRHIGADDTFPALQGVDMDIARGDTVGLIGSNGAGKSTLLRLIAGVGRPDAGTIETRARVTALLDLGTGFHPDLTGRENVQLYGVLMGWSRAEIRRRFDEVVAFAELEAFIENPLRTFSSGMRMRLAFSVATLGSPEILLLDEVMAVGDYAFYGKCVARIDQLRRNGCTLVLCSHDAAKIQSFCRNAAWLDRGRLVAMGRVDDVIDAYTQVANCN